MAKLTLEKAQALLKKHVTEPHLFNHALAVSAAMGAMARHFGAEAEHWEAVGFLHDYDYQQYPEEHLRHTEAPLCEAGVDEESIRAILAHGWGVCSDVEPLTHIFPIKNVFREDVVLESTPREELMKNAPKEKDGQFLVPKTIG